MSYNYDIIEHLPTDDTVLTNNEVEIFDKLFKNDEDVKKIFFELRDTILVGILFIIFSLEPMNQIFHKYITSTKNSPYMLIFIKSLIVMLVFFFLKNMYIVRK
jgi:uncharacterized integral membrane protein